MENNTFDLEKMTKEKQSVAFSSVLAAVFLTLTKIVIGILTGSLGIISEAAHSAIDLGAALVTFFAVKLADKPADKQHHYGHGKIENFSALIETFLLLLTCGWIVYEALNRLFFEPEVKIEVNYFSYGIMALSIIINISRTISLRRVAKKYNSQALEADAIHFLSDIWSSLVVIIGLIFVNIGFPIADPIAALGVSVLVILVCIDLGKRTIAVLLDTAPKGMTEKIESQLTNMEGVLEFKNIRVRNSGANNFIELQVGISRNQSHRGVHNIVNHIKTVIGSQIPNSEITVSTYPVDVDSRNERELIASIKAVADGYDLCTNVHNIDIYEIDGKIHVTMHIEVRENLTLEDAHALSHEIESEIMNKVHQISEVGVFVEESGGTDIETADVTVDSKDMIKNIETLVNTSPENLNCHDIRIFKRHGSYSAFLHCAIKGGIPLKYVDNLSKEIADTIKENVTGVENVFVHMEPIEDNLAK